MNKKKEQASNLAQEIHKDRQAQLRRQNAEREAQERRETKEIDDAIGDA